MGKPFDDLQSDMSEPVLEAHIRDIKAKWRDLSHKDEPEKARQSLIDMVQTEIERTRGLAAEHKQNAGEDAVRIRALKAFENSPKAVAMRREFLKYKGSLERGLVAVRREKRRGRRIAMGKPCPQYREDLSPYDGRPASWWRESVEGRRAEGGGRRAGIRTEDGGAGGRRRTEDRGQKTGIRTEGGFRRASRRTGRVIVGVAGWSRVVVRARLLRSAVRLWRAAQRVCLLRRLVRAGGGIRSWWRNRMFWRVGGICRRSTSPMLRAMAAVRTRLRLRLRTKCRILKLWVPNWRRPGSATWV